MNTQLSLFPTGRLRLFVSNQLEQLATQLTEALATPLDSPFTPETIVVQSRGMGRWLSLQIAAQTGICVNYRFPFPRDFINQVLAAFFPELGAQKLFAPAAWIWRLNALLPQLIDEPAFASVRHYLADRDALKTFQLAGKVAQLFDQYLLYRPEMLLEWERASSSRDWQALLWRALLEPFSGPHLARLAGKLSSAMASPPSGELPARISVFGISSLPPLYLRVLFELSRHCEVNLFWLQPSQEYFGHDLSPKQRARLAAKQTTLAAPTGNPLLASLGKLNRDFVDLRIDLNEQLGFPLQEEPGSFVEPVGHTILHALQRDLLFARQPGTDDVPKTVIDPVEESVSVQVCHSATREVEVLYDHLLAWFAADPTLRPRDVLVMTPDIEALAPYVQAVFGAPEEESRRIPFSIADRRSRSASPVLETFLAILALPGSRCTATEIHALLTRAPIRERFRFTADELEQMKCWIAETGIRWGVDGAHRQSFGVPPLAENTWRTGFDRLLLGFAMAGGQRTMFEGILPYDEVEGSGGELLGRFLTATETLLALAIELSTPRRLRDWSLALERVLEQLFPADSQGAATDLRLIRGCLKEIVEEANLANEATQLVEFRVLRQHLTQLLDQHESRGGFLTGGVTFCALQPMRSIPARIVCLLGMNDTAFPRRAAALAFDLIARQPRPGDRALRDDDRYLFLEALISARDRLYFSYVGRSTRDHREAPPSVLVSEVLDYFDQTCQFAVGENARSRFVTEHRLQAFSAPYFTTGTDVFSYSEANAAAARSFAQAGPRAIPNWLGQPLPAPPEELRTIELSTLLAFFKHPARFFAERQLRVRLEDRENPLEGEEPFALGALQRYGLRQELVADQLNGSRDSLAAMPARQILPLGDAGPATLLALETDSTAFAARVRPLLAGLQAREPLDLQLALSPFRLTGKVEPLYANGQLTYRCAKLKAFDQLRAWITHLALCAAVPETDWTATLLALDGGVNFARPPEPAARLLELLDVYWAGLQTPARFFPEASLAYAEAVAEEANDPLKKARAKWEGTWDYGGESDCPYFKLCFGEADPLTREFGVLAERIYQPLLRARREA